VVHLDDLLLRRTAIGLYERLTEARFQHLAALAADTLGWDAPRRAAEISRTRDLLATKHGVSVPSLNSQPSALNS
jgi:glycerol-3-phosphate dehydrogenase